MVPTKTYQGIYLFIYFYYLRGTMVNRTYGTHKNLHIYLFLLTIFGPIYFGPS